MFLFFSIESDEQGIYDIFTVEKGATYLILGWVKFSEAPNEELTLIQMRNGEDNRTLQRKTETETENQEEIFFGTKVKMAPGAKISISFPSEYKDSSFIVYELWTDWN